MLGITMQGLLTVLPLVALAFLLSLTHGVGLLPGFISSAAAAFVWSCFRVFGWRRGVDSAVVELRSRLRGFSSPADGPLDHHFRLLRPEGSPLIGIRVQPSIGVVG